MWCVQPNASTGMARNKLKLEVHPDRFSIIYSIKTSWFYEIKTTTKFLNNFHSMPFSVLKSNFRFRWGTKRHCGKETANSRPVMSKMRNYVQSTSQECHGICRAVFKRPLWHAPSTYHKTSGHKIKHFSARPYPHLTWCQDTYTWQVLLNTGTERNGIYRNKPEWGRMTLEWHRNEQEWYWNIPKRAGMRPNDTQIINNYSMSARWIWDDR